MYGKHFASMYEGSMMGAGPVVFAVWGYVISKANDGDVELNPRLVSILIGCSVEEVQTAIDYLCRPDPHSRNKEEDGKRLVKTGQFAYRVVSHHIYRAMRDESDRREYNRKKQAEYRAAKKLLEAQDVPECTGVYHGVPPSAHTETETEADTEAKTIKKEKEPFKLPKELESPEFLAVWQNWKRHRMEKHKPLGEIEEQAQLMELIRFGQEAIAVVSFSIRTGALNLICNGDHKPPSKKSTAKTGGVDWSKFGIEVKQ